jgi:hypothetical protein
MDVSLFKPYLKVSEGIGSFDSESVGNSTIPLEKLLLNKDLDLGKNTVNCGVVSGLRKPLKRGNAIRVTTRITEQNLENIILNWLNYTHLNFLNLHDSYTQACFEDTQDKKHSQNTDTNLGTLATKTTPLDADSVIHRDSVTPFELFTTTWTQVKAFLKTYYDTLYLPLAGGTMTGDLNMGSNSIADLATTDKATPVAADKVLILDSSPAQALSLDGSHYVSMGNNFNFDARTQPFSFMGWVKTNTAGHMVLLSKNDSGTGTGYILMANWFGTPMIYFAITQTWGAKGGGVYKIVTLTNWTHLAVTYNGNGSAVQAGMKIYLNAVESHDNDWNGAAIDADISNASNFTLGAFTDGSVPRTGLTQELQVYNKELSLAEVQADYNGGSGVYNSAKANLTGLYHLAGTLNDESGSGFNGSWQGGGSATYVAGQGIVASPYKIKHSLFSEIKTALLTPIYELLTNKVTAFSTPTDTQYPSAKLTYDQLALKEALANKAAASGYASLNASSELVQLNAANSVTLAMLAQQAANTVLANQTAGAAVPTAVAMAASTILARLASGNIVAATTTEMKTLLAYLQIGDAQTTITDSDSYIPTSGAVVDQIALSKWNLFPNGRCMVSEAAGIVPYLTNVGSAEIAQLTGNEFRNSVSNYKYRITFIDHTTDSVTIVFNSLKAATTYTFRCVAYKFLGNSTIVTTGGSANMSITVSAVTTGIEYTGTFTTNGTLGGSCTAITFTFSSGTNSAELHIGCISLVEGIIKLVL